MDNRRKQLKKVLFSQSPAEGTFAELQDQTEHLAAIEASVATPPVVNLEVTPVVKIELPEKMQEKLDEGAKAAAFVSQFVDLVSTKLKGDKGDKGEDGYTPIKGEDYFTDKEVAEFKEQITPKKGVDYVDGKDADEEVIVQKVLKVLPKMKDGKDGKDGQSVDIKEVVTKTIKEIKNQKGDDRLDIRLMKGYNELSFNTKRKLDMGDQRWHGGGLTTVSHDTTLTGDGTPTSPLSAITGDFTWTPEGVTQSTVGGIAAGTDLGTSPLSIADTLVRMFYPYTAPTVTLSAPTTATYEFGNNQSPVSLSATTVKHSLDISSLIFQRSDNGGSYSTVSIVATPNPNGGVETGSNTPSFPLTQVAQVSTLAYRATVGDGTSTSNSNVRTQTYIYPFYYGVGATGLTGAQISALTKLVQTVGNKTLSFSPSNQVYYFAYPASYANLVTILDPNGFDITSDFTLRNPVSITGLDGTTQDYKVYEFNNLTTQTAFNITFEF